MAQRYVGMGESPRPAASSRNWHEIGVGLVAALAVIGLYIAAIWAVIFLAGALL